MSWNTGNVYHSSINPTTEALDFDNNQEVTPDFAKRHFREFLTHFQHEDSQGNYYYRDQLRQHYSLGKYYIEVKIGDLRAFSEDLASALIKNPEEYVPIFELATKEAACQFQLESTIEDVHDIQLTLNWFESKPLNIRDLNADHISRLVCVPGIVINASRTQPKAKRAVIQCTHCGNTKTISVKPGLTGITLPTRCDREPLPGEEACPRDSYVVVSDKCEFVDQQRMKLQESPETVPTGEMPRHILLTAERGLVERVVPGTRVHVLGMYSIFQSKGKGKKGGGVGGVAVRHPYLRVLGIQAAREGAGKTGTVFSADEEETFREMARDPELYEKIANSVDPAIFGHQDIKKAIACQLFGGSIKKSPDGIRRRGDLNILLLGDPSTAKSQLLKFVEKVAPIGVYTSGKGSSAAGLTASVIREPGTGDFYLEGGSMVLADGGVVCIDEFDKMREQDRVAIHEAMEQQTISIAKAGITTVLNSRTSVLAAANPMSGKLDDLKAAEDQIDFQTTILSRFDMIFIVKDIRDERRDKAIARHVLNVHMRNKIDKPESEIDINLLKRYITFCRAKCSPRLSREASKVLSNFYVKVRGSKQRRSGGGGGNVIPITVRQLEAVVRLAESLAKMRLSPVATEDHVNEALRLFSASTLDAINRGIGAEVSMSKEMAAEVQKVETMVKQRLPIGARTPPEHLCAVLQKQGIPRFVTERALSVLVQRNELEFRYQKKLIYRKR